MIRTITAKRFAFLLALAPMLSIGIFPAARAATADKANLLPSFSDAGAWQVSDNGNLQIDIHELQARPLDTFAAIVRHTDGVDWHGSIQPTKTIQLLDGHAYTLTLSARSDSARSIRVLTSLEKGDHRSVGLDATLQLGLHYQSYSNTFTAHGVGSHRVLFQIPIANTTGAVWLKDISLTDNGSSNSPLP